MNARMNAGNARICVALALLGCGSAAYARSYTLQAPTRVDAAWAATVDVALEADPVDPALVRAALAGFETQLTYAGGGRWTGTLALAPVPLPPGSYTIRYSAEDEAGVATPFQQILRLGAPTDGTTPWLPGDRETGGPMTMELLGELSYESGWAPEITVRIEGQGRPARFEAVLAGYRADFVNHGDYRYIARFGDAWMVPPGLYTLRVEAEDNEGATTVLEDTVELVAPADGTTPWLSGVAGTVWEAEPLDFERTVGGEASGGCRGARGGATPWGIGLLLLAVAWAARGRRRGAWAWALAAVTAGCGGGVETRPVGRGEALVQVVDDGEGFTNDALLWPLALGHRRVEGGAHQGSLWVTESWPLTGGGRGLIVRANTIGYGWSELAQTEDGLYAVASARAGRLHRPLLVIPATVRVGMTWRSWARPADAERLDLTPAELVDRSGGFEFRVMRVMEAPGAEAPYGRARVWDIAWKGPLPPDATFDWILELNGKPRTPTRGVMRFVEGYGPSTQSYLPDLSYLEYNHAEAPGEDLLGHPVVPEPSVDDASGPEVALKPVQSPERISGQAVHQVSVLDLEDGHGPWLRLDGNAAGLGYPSSFPGTSGGGGGNANLWVASARSECFAFESGRLVSGQELGVLGEEDTCVHAAGTLVSPSGDAAWEVPFLGYYGAPISKKVLEGCSNHPSCFISTTPVAVLPAPDPTGGANLLVRYTGTPGPWRLARWRAFTWEERHRLSDLELTEVIDGTALDALLADVGSSQLIARPVGEGAIGLLARSATRTGEPTSFGYARLDADGVIRDPVAYGPVGWGTSFRSDASGAEVWQVDRGGRVWEWRFTASGMERRVRARLGLAGDETPTAAVRLDSGRLFVVTAGPGPDEVPPSTSRLECTPAYCWNAPSPAPPRLWTAELPPESRASPWEAPPAILGLELTERADGACVPDAAGPPPALVGPPAGVEATLAEGGRCVQVDTSGATGGPVHEWTARMPGTAAFRVIPSAPLLSVPPQ